MHHQERIASALFEVTIQRRAHLAVGDLASFAECRGSHVKTKAQQDCGQHHWCPKLYLSRSCYVGQKSERVAFFRLEQPEAGEMHKALASNSNEFLRGIA